MKKLLFLVLPAIMILMLPACSGGGKDKKSEPLAAKPAVEKPVVTVGNETGLLLKELVDGGDYVNSQQFPSLIKASLVNEATGKNLVIDLRKPEDFRNGHIKGAVNKSFTELPAYFETGIKPFEYDKIIMVCGDGQLASYATSLLRLKGYGNVYAMRWGMSAWNKEWADKRWLANLSGKYESELDTVTYQKPVPVKMPELSTGLTNGKEIADNRFAKLFSEGSDKAFISADEVFANPSAYFVINLERKDKYQDGHVPGAYRYKPENTLGVIEEMATLPVDKPIVVYCGTGHNSAFATAYLRLFGYDARTLRYGNNSFMYDRMLKKKAELSWLPFTVADVNSFPVVK